MNARFAVKVAKCLEDVGLSAERNILSKKLSGGQKRKLSLAMAIIGDPQVAVFFDLPHREFGIHYLLVSVNRSHFLLSDVHSFVHQGRQLAVGSVLTCLQPTASAEA